MRYGKFRIVPGNENLRLTSFLKNLRLDKTPMQHSLSAPTFYLWRVIHSTFAFEFKKSQTVQAAGTVINLSAHRRWSVRIYLFFGFLYC